MASSETSKTRARYCSSYDVYHGKCPDVVSPSVDLELMALDDPLLPMDEPTTMDKFDWTEKILIVVSVSTVLGLALSILNYENTYKSTSLLAVRCRVHAHRFGDLA